MTSRARVHTASWCARANTPIAAACSESAGSGRCRSDGGNLPILDPALWSLWLPVLIAVLVATVGLEIAKYRAGRWTWPLVAVNAVLDLAFAVPVVWLLLTDRLLNPEFVARFEWLGEGDNLDTVATVAVVGTILIVLWDIVDSVVKAYRNRR